MCAADQLRLMQKVALQHQKEQLQLQRRLRLRHCQALPRPSNALGSQIRARRNGIDPMSPRSKQLLLVEQEVL